uniref:Uncharacterized protein n=1 Tax=Romanomermis culicivorax TaxID=13658 RepID=A0A915LB37_ROMCU
FLLRDKRRLGDGRQQKRKKKKEANGKDSEKGFYDNHSLIPTNYILYPFDLCAKIKKNQSLPCLHSGFAEINTTAFFTYSRTGKDTSANVKIKISKHCRLHISIKKNYVPLQFDSHMDWGWGSKEMENPIESEYASDLLKVTSKGIILDATNTTIQESAVPITYNLCAPPNDIDPPPLSASYRAVCYAIADAHHTKLFWQNFNGEMHYENVTIQLYRSMNCDLRLNVVWREKVYKTTFGATNIKVEEQNMNDKICMGWMCFQSTPIYQLMMSDEQDILDLAFF